LTSGPNAQDAPEEGLAFKHWPGPAIETGAWDYGLWPHGPASSGVPACDFRSRCLTVLTRASTQVGSAGSTFHCGRVLPAMAALSLAPGASSTRNRRQRSTSAAQDRPD